MTTRKPYCSFCRKSYTDVGPLVEGPEEVYICGECIELCQSIIDGERRRRNPPPQALAAAQLRSKLDHLLSGHDEAKQVLAMAAGSRNERSGRVLLIGPSSSAKIFLARALAHALDAPFAAADSSSLVARKHDAMDVSPLLLRLLQASDFDVAAVQRGVVFVDGAEQQNTQAALLRLWQEKLLRLGVTSVVTSGILFVCGATFVGLDESIARLGRHPEQPVTVEGLVAVGVRPDWAGCLTGIARVAPLDVGSLERIVRSVDFARCDVEEVNETSPVRRAGLDRSETL